MLAKKYPRGRAQRRVCNWRDFFKKATDKKVNNKRKIKNKRN